MTSMTTATSIGPSLPPADGAGAFFWEGARAGRLLILRCQQCGTYIHLPRPVCRSCGSFDLAPEQVSGRGTLYSYTTTMKAFHPFYVDRLPYVLVTVELAEQPGLMLLSNIAAGNDRPLEFGMDLAVQFEALSPDLTIPVFAPAVSA
jgi:uncharacterized protein